MSPSISSSKALKISPPSPPPGMLDDERTKRNPLQVLLQQGPHAKSTNVHIYAVVVSQKAWGWGGGGSGGMMTCPRCSEFSDSSHHKASQETKINKYERSNQASFCNEPAKNSFSNDDPANLLICVQYAEIWFEISSPSIRFGASNYSGFHFGVVRRAR